MVHIYKTNSIKGREWGLQQATQYTHIDKQRNNRKQITQ